jgi:TolB-like protein/DNA-binding winged helix-turn-helix (wHTH) protein/Flp pilus assembly protein TadD
MAAPVPISARLLQFDSFELDVHAGELRKRGIKLPLQGQPIQVLAILLEKTGQLVTREEFRSQLWSADTFVDFDHSLHNAIARLRETLGDSAEKPRYIETLPRRGYRFIASVEEVGVQAKPSVQTEHATATPTRVQSKLRLSLAFALLTVITIGLALWVEPTVSHRTSAAGPIRSIAVLPLANLSGDPSQEYFADAMTDELITELAKVGALRVTSRITVTRYKHTNQTVPEIARELNVDGILEGSIVRSGQRVRITAQLVYAPADQHLWAETYERDLADVLRLQGEVAQAITQHVRAQLTPEVQAQFRGSRLVDPEAYDAYLMGRYYLYNQQFTMPGPLNQAKTYFEEAVRKDPGFSLAYSGLANAYLFLVFFGQGQVSAEDGYKLAKQAVQKALELDENNGEAYDVLGQLSWHADLDWNAADRAFSQSLALAPSFSCAHEDRALFLAFRGRRAEALAEVEKSKQLDPGAGPGVELAAYFQLRDWERLVEAGRREVAANPNEWTVHANLGAGYAATGKMPEAIAEYQKAIELSNGNLDAVASLGHAYAVTGQRTKAQKILHGLEQKAKNGKASPYLPATIYAGLGEKDKAFELIEKAYRESSLDVAWILKPDLRTDSLRSDPRFVDLLRRVGLSN